MSEVNFKLPNKKILVKPILKEGGWLPQGHSGSFMYDNSKIELQAPISGMTGRVINPLKNEEITYLKTLADFENTDFTVNTSNPGNFWANRFVRLLKAETIVSDKTVLRTLDLNDPNDFIDWKILLANSDRRGGLIAPSYEERYNSGTYKIALVDAEYDDNVSLEGLSKLKKANKFFYTIDNSDDAMYDFLMMHFFTNKSAKQPSKNAKSDFYKIEIQKIIDNDIDSFLKVAEDKDYDTKLTVIRGKTLGLIDYVKNVGFSTADGISMGKDLNQAVEFLKDVRNQDHLLKIEAQIKNK